MANIAAAPASAVTVKRPIAREAARASSTDEPAGASRAERKSGRSAGLSMWRSVARLSWALAGVLTAVLTLAWVLWFNPHPLLGPGGPNMPLTCRTSLPAYAAALTAWGCFSMAFRR
jgi:hypothetical protein